MTKSVKAIALSPSRDIPFDSLMLSQANVRHVKAGVSIEELTESRGALYSRASPCGPLPMRTARRPEWSKCRRAGAATAR